LERAFVPRLNLTWVGRSRAERWVSTRHARDMPYRGVDHAPARTGAVSLSVTWFGERTSGGRTRLGSNTVGVWRPP
jgi:hypothetical protein